MYRADNSTNTGSLPVPGAVGPNPDGFYQDTAGGGGTVVNADHLNAMQEELAYVVENNGDTLSKTDRTQVDKAIRDIVAASSREKAFVRFDGTGAISDSFNVASVTRDSVGKYTIVFSSALLNANYAMITGGSSGLPLVPDTIRTVTPTASQFQIETYKGATDDDQGGFTSVDFDIVSVTVFGS